MQKKVFDVFPCISRAFPPEGKTLMRSQETARENGSEVQPRLCTSEQKSERQDMSRTKDLEKSMWRSCNTIISATHYS